MPATSRVLVQITDPRYVAIRYHKLLAPIRSERSGTMILDYVQVGPDHWQVLDAFEAYEFVPLKQFRHYPDERYFRRVYVQAQALCTIPIRTLAEIRGRLLQCLDARVHDLEDAYYDSLEW